ncbi:MAG: hypothetical protein K2X27_17690 [Candidatus Obscuribacterales bacterium]|nr:hypothetical protein [Candidatus Obscuribacterales bacterium]
MTTIAGIIKGLRKRAGVQSGFCLLLIAGLSGSLPKADASTPRQLVSRNLQTLSAHTSQLVSQVQGFLQAGGRWSPSPQGQDMILCQALQNFQQSLAQMTRDNSSGSFNTIQSDYQALQVLGQNLEQQIAPIAQSPLVSSAWMQVRADMAALNQSIYAVPSFNPAASYDSQTGLMPGASNSTFQPALPPGNFNPINSGYFPGYYPGFRPTNINITENSTFDPNPNAQSSFSNFPQFGTPASPFVGPSSVQSGQNHSQVLSYLSSADTQSERFVKQLSGYLQVKGSWPPPQGTPAMQLCQNLQVFQQQMRRFRDDLHANISYPMLQNEMQQIGASSQAIDQLLMQIGATPDIISRWNEVRSAMNNAYQAFYSSGGTNYWAR